MSTVYANKLGTEKPQSRVSLLRQYTNHDKIKESTPREAAWFLLESFVSGWENFDNSQKIKIVDTLENWLMREAAK